MNNVVDCVGAVSRLMDKVGVDTHSIQQLQAGMQQSLQGLDVKFEQVRQFQLQSRTGESIEVNRIVDVVARAGAEVVNTEIKTGYRDIAKALNIDQMMQDAAIAIKNMRDRVSGDTKDTLENVTRLIDQSFGTGVPQMLKDKVGEVISGVVGKGFSLDELRAAIGSFSFVDNAGKVIQAELNEHGEVIFRDAMGHLLGSDGTMAKVALSAATHSPDFTPAMNAIFGATGKVADAARDAAQSTNIDAAFKSLDEKLEDGVKNASRAANFAPAMESFENKLEDGVKDALDDAGNAAAAGGAKALGGKIAAGATALGDILTSVPQLYESVNKLGEAWDKPLNSTEDYMNLFAAAGDTIGQGVQTFQALAGVTQIASAAQAVFNAVMAMNPVVLIVMAVIALIAVIVLLIVYWDQVKAALRDNPWLAVAAVMFGLIGIIVVIIAYWDEIKLAVLKAANFVSIQVQKIGQFFVGLGTLIGQVWDYITASVENVGIAILNSFISIGVSIQNFFIGVINGILEMYNEVANSVVGDLAGLEPAELIPEVELETKLIPPRDVPQIDVEAAFKTGEVKGGLEGAIAEQEGVLRKAQAEDEARRAEKAKAAAAPPAATGVPGVPGGLPAVPGAPAPPAVPTLPPAPPAAERPPLPQGAMAAAAPPAAAGPVDASVTLNGGITVNINAERLEADAGQLLSDEIINAIQARLGSLRSEQDFRVGVRAPAS